MPNATSAHQLVTLGQTDDRYLTGLSVRTYGATGSGDDITTAIQSVVDVLAVVGGGACIIPAGFSSVLSATITISNSKIEIVGGGMWNTTLTRASDYGDTFFFTGNDSTGVVISNVGIRDLSIISTAKTTSGAHIHMNGVARFRISGIYMLQGFKGYQFDGATAGYVSDIYTVFTDLFTGSATNRRFMAFGVSGANYTNRNCGDLFISDFNLRGNTSGTVTEIGVYIACADGIWFGGGHVGNCTVANLCISAETSLLNLVFFENVMSDEGTGYSLLFQGSTSWGRSINFTNCNFKGGATTTTGIITSSSAKFYGVSFTGCTIWEHGQYGVRLDSTDMRRTDFTGCHVRGNSLSSAGTYSGYYFTTSVQDVTITGGNSGGDNDDPTAAGVQSYGIHMAGSNTNMLITGVDLRGNQTGSIVGNSGQYRNCLTQDSTTVASAATLTVPPLGDVFHVSGTTTITNMQVSWAGRTVTLIFDGILTFTDGGNLKLAGNFVTTADDAITMSYDGTNWYESSRSVN